MDNDDLRDFLLRHRRIMTDTELARIAGITPQALNHFITKHDRTHGNTFRLAALQRALGLEVDTHIVKTVKVETRVIRTWKPKEEI